MLDAGQCRRQAACQDGRSCPVETVARRKPRRHSNESGLLDRWPADGPPLAWKARGLGRGFSSLSIADGRIFTMGDRDQGQFVIALNLADGKELWATRIGDVWEPQGYAGPRCTPTVDGALVYATGPHGDIVCLECATGKEIWHRNMIADFQGRMHSGWGFSESPLVDQDRLVCTPGGADAAIVALDKKTGTEIWRASIPALGNQGGDGAAYSSIVIGNGGGVRQYVQLMGRGAVAVAAKDGQFLWGYNRVANGTANMPTPLVHGDYVFCSSGYQTGAALLELRAKPGGGVDGRRSLFSRRQGVSESSRRHDPAGRLSVRRARPQRRRRRAWNGRPARPFGGRTEGRAPGRPRSPMPTAICTSASKTE